MLNYWVLSAKERSYYEVEYYSCFLCRAYESRAYPPPNGPDEDELIPLRKAGEITVYITDWQLD